MLFSKSFIANTASPGVNERNAQAQFQEVLARREYFDNMERSHALMQGHAENAAAVIPQDVYREFDRTITRVFRNDEGDNLLNALMPLSRSIDIGKIEYSFARASDSGNAQTSLSGQTPVLMDKAQYAYDSAFVPVHQTSFGRQWRELAGQRSEGFDGLIDDQENSLRALKRQMVSHILDGSDITFKGARWDGLRNDSRVASIDLGAGGLNIDFTDPNASAKDIRDGFQKIRDVIRIQNNVYEDITFFVSREIMSNLERYYSDYDATYQTLAKSIAGERGLNGIKEIKETAALTGNQMLPIALSNRYIRPLVGMGINTMAVPRLTPFEAHNFITWSAMGIQVVTDFDGRTGVAYASS